MTSSLSGVPHHACVGVLQTSSERDHNSEAGKEAFLDVPIEWVRYEFFDELSVDEFIDGIRSRRFASVCFASNSLFNPVSYAAISQAADEIAEASRSGLSIVLLQQFKSAGEQCACEFLPSAHQLDFRGQGYQRFTQVDVEPLTTESQPLTLAAREFGDRETVLWSTPEPRHPGAWCAIASVTVEGAPKAVLMRTLASHGRVIASALPLDWLPDRRLLTYAIQRSVRASGTLYVHPPDSTSTKSIALELLLGRATADGGHLSSIAIKDPSVVSSREPPYEDFSHLVISEAWGWPQLTGLVDERIRGRLENGGSVTCFVSTPDSGGKRVLATVAGRPAYLQLADRFASWFARNRAQFDAAPATQVRALAVAARAIHDETVDADEIPRDLALSALRSHFGEWFQRRLDGTDNVDGHVLPTASVASAKLLLKYEADEVAPLIDWIKKRDYVSSVAAVQQAALWLKDIEPPSEPTNGNKLESMYSWLLALRHSPNETAQDTLLEMLQEPDAEVDITRKAIIAETLTQYPGNGLRARVAGAAARKLQNDLERGLAANRAPLEVTCLLTAILVRIHATQEFSAGNTNVVASYGTPAHRDRPRRTEFAKGRQQRPTP